MFDQPTFLIHLGSKGKRLVLRAIKDGYADGAVLSPADYAVTDNRGIAKEVSKKGGSVFFDPQFYNPRADNDNLNSHNYFADHAGPEEEDPFSSNSGFNTSMLDNSAERSSFCDSLASFQDSLDVDAFISPSRHLQSLSQATLMNWKELTSSFIDSARDKNPDLPIYVSLPLDSQPLSEPEQPGRLLNYVTSFDVEGFYLSLSTNEYYSFPLTGLDNLRPLLSLIDNLKTNRYNVVMGHSHHVGHLLFGAGADAFCSGHYKNLRTLDMSRFSSSEPGGGSIVFNYYSEPLLNELRVASPTSSEESDDDADTPASYSDLDLLSDRGFDLSKIRCSGSPTDDTLFSGSGLPSESQWSKKDGEWIHYIWACNQIACEYEEIGGSDKERAQHALERVKDAEDLYQEIDEAGILLDEPEERVYSDWKNALNEVILSD